MAEETTQAVQGNTASAVIEALEPKRKKQTLSEMDEEIKRNELEMSRLALEEKKASLTDLRERLADRELQRSERQQVYLTRGDSLTTNAANDASAQKRCNHRKGGDGAAGVIGGRGTDQFYAILQHKFANGDVWVRCLRCGKTWKPPIRKRFKTQGEYEKAFAEYRVALDFPTRNQPSGGIVYQFSDNGEHYREMMEHVTLR